MIYYVGCCLVLVLVTRLDFYSLNYSRIVLEHPSDLIVGKCQSWKTFIVLWGVLLRDASVCGKMSLFGAHSPAIVLCLNGSMEIMMILSNQLWLCLILRDMTLLQDRSKARQHHCEIASHIKLEYLQLQLGGRWGDVGAESWTRLMRQL